MAYVLPHLYDAFYSYKDYEGESAHVTELVVERNPGARTLLDVACGTGKHLEILRASFDVEGCDLNEELLAIARERLDAVPLEFADMRSLDLGRRFDAITCLFSAIGHMRDVHELHAAVAAMARHLEVGGVLIVEPWIAPDAWIPGKPALLTIDEPDLTAVRMTAAGRRNAVSIVDFHYLIGTPDGVESHFEHMELGLFTAEQMMASFEAAGLVVEHDPEGLIGRGLFMGVRETPETG